LKPCSASEVENKEMGSIVRPGLATGLVALLGGIIFAGGSALAAGDWWLAREPWIGLGLGLLTVGLVITGVSALYLDAVAPIGRLRLLAVPHALFVAALWLLVLLLAAGVGTTGAFVPGAPQGQFDVGVALYSEPRYLIALVLGTLAVGSPLLIARLRRPG